MNNSAPIYVVCPAHIATGGTEAAHVLCYELLRLGLNATIFYTDVKAGTEIVPKRFLRFNTPFLLELNDAVGSSLVIPETRTDLIDKFPLMKKYIWWLSVDNYVRPFKFSGPRNMYCLLKDRMTKRNVNFSDRSISHLCQSYYAMDFVKKQGATDVRFLMDYLGEEHLIQVEDKKSRENVVLYNPAKGITFTKKIIKASPSDFRFIPLCNMSPEEVHDWCCRAKVYIDFGNHPGKDRFPREAAMAGCLILTSKRGSAGFHEDMPINPEYKFQGVSCEVSEIIDLISDCMHRYDDRIADFENYRTFIREDRDRFIAQTRDVFLQS